MGGDRAPQATVKGAIRAKQELGLEVVLVGQEEVVWAELDKHGARGEIPVYHASEVVAMDESPVKAARSKLDSSIHRAFDLIKKGQAEAVISAGNSGAVMACAVLLLGRIKGIDRPALATVFPSLGDPTVVIDVGANVDSQPRHLLQFGLMGDIFAREVLGYKEPRVGLLSVGEEDVKGNDQTRRTHDLLKKAALNFVGNVEGRDLFAGKVQVVVCDGFVGNVCLKLTEGVALAMYSLLKREIMASAWTKLGGLMLKPAFHRFDKLVNYAEYGGAPLLGLNGSCLICHGSSDDRAIMNAVRMASDWVGRGFNDKLALIMKDHQKTDNGLNAGE
ncbi:MAG: phosphate acyltransferase PlsX [Deltaproteobacteria bacterium]|nr:phosphate acyltransferase PlsX [Deltaproteobacteria bacterium]